MKDVIPKNTNISIPQFDNEAYNQLLEQLNEVENFISDCKRNIEAVIRGYKALICDGTKPDFMKIDDGIIKELTLLVLSDLNINQLPDEHMFAVVNVPSRREDILSSSAAELKLHLDAVLRTREYKLNDETVNYAVLLKLEALYNSLKDRVSLEIEKIVEGLLKGGLETVQIDIISTKLNEIKSYSKAILKEKEPQLKACTLSCVESFNNNLHSSSDKNLGIDVKGRFERIINVIRGTSYILDLANVNLGLAGNYLKEMDLADVPIVLDAAQEDEYLSQEQREGRLSGRLFKAAEKGDLAELRTLIEDRKIGINYANSAGRTPLMTAAIGEQVEATKFLIMMGADVNKKTASGKSLLEGLASLVPSENTDAIIKELITAGATVTVHIAAMIRFRDLESFNTIWHIGEINRLEKGYTALHCATRAGHLRNVEWLKGKGARLDIVSQDGYNVLHIACMEGYEDIALFLLKSKMDINKQASDFKGSSAVSVAIESKHFELAIKLCKRGAAISQAQGEILQAYTKQFHPEQDMSESSWQQRVIEGKAATRGSCQMM